MKTVFYRIGKADAVEWAGWTYKSFRCNSDLKITKEMCYRDTFGEYYLDNLHNKIDPDILVEVIKEVEDEY